MAEQYGGMVEGLESDDAPDSGHTGRGRDGEFDMPKHSWTMQRLFVEMMYFCASHCPSHEMRARPVDLCPFPSV